MLWSDRCLLKAHVVCCAEWIEGNRANLHGPGTFVYEGGEEAD